MDTYFLVLSFSICIFLVLAYLCLYLQYHQRSLLLWGLAGFIYVCEYCLDISIIWTSMPPILQYIDWCAVELGTFLMLWGIYLHIDKPLPIWVIVGYLVCLVVLFIILICIPFSAGFILAYVCEGLGLVWAGMLLFRHSVYSKLCTYITGVSLFIWGLTFFSEIGRINLPRFTSTWGYVLVCLFGTTATIGFMVLCLHKIAALDKNDSNLMKYVSHELKTSAMVIRGYAQSMRDGVYPTGSLNGSIDMINSEADQMEKRLHNMLYLNKLNYLITHNSETMETLSLGEIVEAGIERFCWRRPDLVWEKRISPVFILGDRQQWNTVIDNLLDNQLRYAHHCISLSVNTDALDSTIVLRIWNDGPTIEPLVLKTLFNDYQTGIDGQYGLGLAIVKKIVEAHHGKIWIENEAGGVAFYIHVPSNANLRGKP